MNQRVVTKSDEQIVGANGIEIAYDTFGDPAAPPLLLVMGLGMQMTSWDEQLCALLAEQGYWVIRFDNRDVGRSTRFEQAGRPNLLRMATAGFIGLPMASAYRLSDMAADAIGLLDVLGINKAHVIGVSMGGMIAQELAIRYPQRLLSMTSIMSTTGDPSLPQANLKLRLRLLKRAPAEEQAYIEHVVQLTKILNGSVYPPDEQRIRQLAKRNFHRGYYPVGVARQLAAIIASGDRSERLAAVRTPTLVIHGTADPLVPVAGGRATARAIPRADLLTIPHMGHGLPRDLWPQLVEALSSHMGSVSR